MLDRLAGPHDIEARVLEGQRPFGLHQAQVELGVARPGTPQGLPGDVNRHHLGSATHKGSSEVAFRAAEVEHTRSSASAFPLGGHVA
jgi:hypothetical protein